jgi:hypothetical protein
MPEEALLSRLSAPFSPTTVSWRVGSTNKEKTRGMALAYVDARDVQDRLNETCGTDWQVRFPWAIPGKMTCEIGIKIDGEWIWRGDGAGDTDFEAEKGAFSDAFKRAAVRWGVARYLYDVDAPWVAIEPLGKSFIIPANELARLRGLLEKGARPTPATSANNETLSQIRDRIHRALSQTNEKLTPDHVLLVNQADMKLIEGASKQTHARLIAYAEQRKAELAEAELAQPIPSDLVQKLREGLTA